MKSVSKTHINQLSKAAFLLGGHNALSLQAFHTILAKPA